MVDQVQSRCKEHLGKIFHFSEDTLTSDTDWPLFTTSRWECPDRLTTLKAQLNLCKSRLNRLPLQRWHAHTKNENPAADVAKAIRAAHVELLTQAWCKFHEIFNAFNDLVDHQAENLHTVHLCEAPGAFVAALNHNLRQRQHQHLEDEEKERKRTEQEIEVHPEDVLAPPEKFHVKSLDCHSLDENETANVSEEDPAQERTALEDAAEDQRDRHDRGHCRLKALHKQSPPDLDWHWRATTLNPFYEGNHTGEMINDDRLILHTLKQWDFGADDSGDLLAPVNRLAWAVSLKKCCAGAPIALVTADGSIDCQCDPANQEEIVAPLHLAEAALALALLAGATGGNLVLKMFTFYECSSVGLLYLLVKTFHKISVFKPSTSKEGNSEVYVVCRKFRDNLSAPVIQLLLENAHAKDRVLFPKSGIPSQFMQEVILCAETFKNYQVTAIERNLGSFHLDPDTSTTEEAGQIKTGCNSPSEEVKLLRSMVASEFLRLYPVHSISNQSKIVPAGASQPRTNLCLNLDRRDVEVGTFEDRVLASTSIDRQRLRDEIWSDLRCNWVQFRKVEWMPSPSPPSAFDKIVYGKPLSEIHSSKYCPGKALRLYRQAFQIMLEGSSTQQLYHSKAKKPRWLEANGSDPPVGTLVNIEDLLSSVPILSNLAKLYPEIKGKTMVLRMAKDMEPCTFDIHALTSNVSMLRTVLSQIEVGEHLVLMELSCLTRLEVALLHIVGGCFAELGLVRPQGCHAAIFLSEFKASKDSLQLLQDFEALLEKSLSDKETQLIQAFEITELVQEPLYPFLVAYNVLNMREKSLFILKEKP